MARLPQMWHKWCNCTVVAGKIATRLMLSLSPSVKIFPWQFLKFMFRKIVKFECLDFQDITTGSFFPKLTSISWQKSLPKIVSTVISWKCEVQVWANILGIWNQIVTFNVKCERQNENKCFSFSLGFSEWRLKICFRNSAILIGGVWGTRIQN